MIEKQLGYSGWFEESVGEEQFVSSMYWDIHLFLPPDTGVSCSWASSCELNYIALSLDVQLGDGRSWDFLTIPVRASSCNSCLCLSPSNWPTFYHLLMDVSIYPPNCPMYLLSSTGSDPVGNPDWFTTLKPSSIRPKKWRHLSIPVTPANCSPQFYLNQPKLESWYGICFPSYGLSFLLLATVFSGKVRLKPNLPHSS